MDPKGGTLVQWPEEDLLYFSSGGWGKIAHFYTTTEGLYIYYFLSITNSSQLWVSCTLLRSFAMPLQVSLGFLQVSRSFATHSSCLTQESCVEALCSPFLALGLRWCMV